MSVRIRFSEQGKRTLQALHITTQRNIKAALKKLAIGEMEGKALTAQLIGFCTLTIGNYRAIYKSNHEEIIVHYVGHRSTVYFEAVRDNRE